MFRTALAACLLFLSAACSQLPRAELQAYRDSFQAAQTAAEPLITDYAVAERALLLQAIQRDAGRTFAVDGYFSDLQPNKDAEAISPLTQPPGAAALNRIFEGIALYNETLVSLAENRNVDAARTQLQQLNSSVTGLLPGLGGVEPVVSAGVNVLVNLLQPLVAADNRVQFREKVIEGYPLVVELIGALREFAAPQFATRVAGLLEELQTEADDADRQRLITEINAWHTAYANYVGLLNAMETRLSDLKEAVRNPRSAPILERAVQGAAEVRAYADTLRLSIAQIRVRPAPAPAPAPAQP